MLRFTHKHALLRTFAMVCLLTAVGQSHAARAQSLSGFERDRGRLMINLIKDDIKKHYYDSNFHGVDVDTRFKAAEEKIKDASSLGQVFGIIAQAVLDLDDSHTFFTPPPRADRFDYG